MASELYDLLSGVSLSRRLTDNERLIHLCVLVDLAGAVGKYKDAWETKTGDFAARKELFEAYDRWMTVNGA